MAQAQERGSRVLTGAHPVDVFDDPMTAAATTASAPARRPPGFIGFLTVLLALLSVCWVTVGVIVAPVLPGGGWTVVVAVVVVTVVPFGLFIGARMLGHYPGRLFRLTVFRFLWYAHFLLLVLLFAGIFGCLVGAVIAIGRGDAEFIGDFGRMAMFAATVVYGVGMFVGYRGVCRLVVTRFEAHLATLPAALDGLTIVQISDVHVGPHTPARHLRAIVREAHAAQPDVIVITGDLIDDFDEDVEYYAKGLGELTAPLGVFVIPGNHDIYANWTKVIARLTRLPVTVLVNAHATVTHRGATFAIAGTGDPAAGPLGSAFGGPDVQATLADIPDDMFVLALAHNPALWPALAGAEVPLTLSGHTHWGQLAIPSLNWCLASPFLKHAMGSHVQGTSLLYIHPGTNYWGIPFRLGAPAEVAVITLRCGATTRMGTGTTTPAAR